jgi:predicted NUDIX family NTP pyrophosphohydrolase
LKPLGGGAPRSAGILLWRRGADGIELLLAHFGGPYWASKDAGAWSIPKGLIEPGESSEQAARREFAEELGAAPPGPSVALPPLRQKGGKWVEAFAVEGEFDPADLASNSFTMEWPRGSGRLHDFPEVDQVRWFTPAEAAEKILPSQRPLIEALRAVIAR